MKLQIILHKSFAILLHNYLQILLHYTWYRSREIWASLVNLTTNNIPLAKSLYIQGWQKSKYRTLNGYISWMIFTIKWKCKNHRKIVLCSGYTAMYVFTLQSCMTTIFLVSGLGVQDKHYGLPEFPIWLHVISCCEFGLKQRWSYLSQEHLMNGNNKFQILLPLFSLTFVKIHVQPLSSMLQKCMQNAGAYVKIWH